MTEKLKIYFAHGPADFNTPFEREVVAFLSETYEVINPNCPDGAEAYQHRDFNWFMNQCEKADCCAVLPLPNGMIGSGVGANCDSFFDREADVFMIETITTHAEHMEEHGAKFTLRKVSKLQTPRWLSGKETAEQNRHYRALVNGGRPLQTA